MSDVEGISYSALINQLNRRSHRAVLSQLGFQRKPLNEYLQSLWQSSAGKSGSFLSDPVFEATFGYEAADKTMKQLSGELIDPLLVKALDKPPSEYRKEYSFKKEWYPYSHQMTAWSRLMDGDPSSVLVSSGTGSGKTECFLIPILNDLVKQSQTLKEPLEGVQALFLYPLNALIESQQERLSAWSREFGGDLRYCLYNGNTPTSPPRSDIQRQCPEQVLSRAALRSSPPPILVTNSTMLEYMLVRQDDQPILEKSQGKLKWIVLDEAHTYVGSNAAEIAMLLRRVMHSFAVKPEDVRFVATSATIGSSDDETLLALKTFLADVAGVALSQVHVVTGGRDVPRLLEEQEDSSTSIRDIKSWKKLETEQRWNKVSHSRMLRGLRNFLTGGEVAQKTLSDTVAYLYDYAPDITRSDALELIDLCAATSDKAGSPFLPTRLHLFEKTLGGLWGCVNRQCAGRQNTPLDSEEWSYGKVFTTHRDSCDCCDMPVYEILSCSDCGAEYLSAQEVARGHEYFLQAYSPDDGVDEFQLDIDFDLEETDRIDACNESRRLISAYGGDRRDWVSSDGLVTDRGKVPPQCEVELISPDEGRLWCACCGTKDSPGFSKFRFKQLGAPFFLGDILPTVLEYCPPGEGTERSGPAEGRRLLTFTDSRQGTARIAARLQQDTDRNFVRSQLYQQVLPVEGGSSSEEIPADIDIQIKEFEEQLAANLPASIKKSLERGYQELLDLRDAGEGSSVDLPVLSWQEAVQSLTHCREIRQWMRDGLTRMSGVSLSEEEFANFCLFREFARRPKRGNQSETLGLVKLVYPKIEELSKIPDQWLRWGGSLDDWRDFLSIFIDHHIRENSCINIDHKFVGWMGASIRVKYIQSPHKTRVSGLTNVVYWPVLGDRKGRVPRMAGLLLEGFNLNRDEESVRRAVNHTLEQAWSVISPWLDSMSDGYLLNFQKSVEFTGLTAAWRCPYTMRILPRAFRGLSPYTVVGNEVGKALKCSEVEMPVFPYRHWRDELGKDVDPEQVRDWMDTDSRINSLREKWLWPNRSDRTAEGEAWLAIGEHSAQQSKPVLDRLTEAFKAGKMNILSCSTTMEMGVDIGGMSAVAMNNVPPGQANYLQRAGRAGRRKESSSVCVTLCGQTAHGIEVFNNPLWPFDPEGISVPKVALHSRSLVQRHANAFLLSEWLKRSGLDIPKLNCGWFYEDSIDGIRANDFRAWVETLHESDQDLSDRLKHLAKGTALASSTVIEITQVCADAVNALNNYWQREFGELKAKLDALEATKKPDENRIPIRAINFQLKALRSEYLLKDLTNKTLLPGHGFPSGIVTLLTSTLDDFRRPTDPSDETREDVSVQRSIGPSRDRSVGIREFAPGAEIVVNGVVHRSQGITLNRHIPAHVEGKQEIQDINWHWHCRKCGSGGISTGMPESCAACSSSELETRQVITPNGFAVDLRYERHNDVSAPTYLPYNPPRVNFGGALWRPFSNPKVGRVRSTDQASVMHWNGGSHENAGYAVCFYCGRAEMQLDEQVPAAFQSPHKRLRGGKESDNEMHCPGSDTDWAIKRNLWLIDESVTSAIELQLRDPSSGAALQNDKVAWSVAYGLRHGLVRVLGITESEVSVRVQKFVDSELGPVQSIFLYDSAVSGAGYVTQFTDYLNTVLSEALELFDCPDNCDSACNACLVSWDSQYQRDFLDRYLAREFLSGWKQHLVLPKEYRVLGEESEVELKSLSESIRSISYKSKINKINLFLGGDPDQWDLSSWSILKEINRWIDEGIKAHILVDADSINGASDSQKRILASLIALGSGNLTLGRLSVPNDLTANAKLLLSLDGDIPIAWAGIAPEVIPGNEWGGSDLPLIKANISLPSLPSDEVSEQDLLGTASTGVESKMKIRLQEQCDGRLSDFGGSFWALIESLKSDITSSAITELYYRDRYLCSPIQLALLGKIISSISGDISDNAEILIDTMTMQEPRYQPSSFTDNWSSETARASVVTGVLKEIAGCEKVNVRSYDRKSIAHSRELKLKYSSGESLEVFLDEGVSCWRLSGYKSYDFSVPTSAQVKTIRSLDGYISMAHKRIGSWMFVSKEPEL